MQLIGGIVLYEGKIAEMATGEGKTFVAPLACFMRALEGMRCHVVTVNDYLVRRDANWVQPAFENLGLTVGFIQSDMEPGGETRRRMYECDVTYGTNAEFGFDYLRDNMKERADLQVQGPLDFAIDLVEYKLRKFYVVTLVMLSKQEGQILRCRQKLFSFIFFRKHHPI